MPDQDDDSNHSEAGFEDRRLLHGTSNVPGSNGRRYFTGSPGTT